MTDERQRIVHGQLVTLRKLAFARQLRREMTRQERTLWERLRDKKLNGWKFRRQQVIDGFIADFFCAKAGVVVENWTARFTPTNGNTTLTVTGRLPRDGWS